jgi:hypothetical protein
LEFSQEQDFLESNLITADHMVGKPVFSLEMHISAEKRTPLELSSPDSELQWSCLTVPPRKWRSGEELLRSSRTTLEQFALRKILLLREIQGWSAPGRIPFKKKV